MRGYIGILLLLFGSRLFAQVFFHANGEGASYYSNPSISGLTSKLSLHTLYRKSWVSAQAPVVIGVSVHLPFRFERYGVGMVVLQEQAATATRLHIQGDFSSKIILGNGFLSYGGRLGVTQLQAELNSDKIKNPDDPLANFRTVRPDAALGLLYVTKQFYVGLDYHFQNGLYRAAMVPYKSIGSALFSYKKKIQQWESRSVLSIMVTRNIKPLIQGYSQLIYRKMAGIGLGAKSPGIGMVSALLNLQMLTGKDILLCYTFEKRFSSNLSIPDQGHEIQVRMLLRKSASVENIRNMRTTKSPLDFQ